MFYRKCLTLHAEATVHWYGGRLKLGGSQAEVFDVIQIAGCLSEDPVQKIGRVHC